MNEQTFWNKIAYIKSHNYINNAFYKYKKGEHIAIINYWGNELLKGRILKTDLFEEAVGVDYFLPSLNIKNKNIFGIDISPYIVKLAKIRFGQINKNNIKYSACDVRNICFKKDCFDLIISNSTLDHFKDLDSAFHEFYRIIKPGGILILTLNNKFNLSMHSLLIIRKIFNIKDQLSGYEFTVRYLEKKLEKIGFKVEDSTTILHVFAFILVSLFLEKGSKTANWFIYKIVYFSELFYKKYKILKKYTGLLIALKVTKPKIY
jgi:SAM-dependent methyltransferase